MFPGPLGVSLAGRALASGLWALEAHDIRASATDRHRSVDDTPAGGGPGMVLRADVLAAAIDAADVAPGRPRLLMSPRGRPLTQTQVMELAAGPGPLILASGTEESFSEGLLEYPQYTRPQEFEGRQIPEILVSGDHAKVAAWRLAQSEALTAARRPDLWARPRQRLGAPPMEISMNLIQQLEKEQFDKLAATKTI
ncbi:tRNA (guanine-N(1)-)-methyltransferase, partial [Aduncisulcus paluster]